MNITINTPGAPPIELSTRHDGMIVLNWSIGNNLPLPMDTVLARILCDHLNDLCDELEERNNEDD